MTFNQLEYFLALADNRNFTKAAAACFTSQPNLSRQISHMEKELGCKLFVRDKHSVTLTPAGELLKKQGRQIDDIYKKTLFEIQELSDTESIRFGLINGIQILFDTMKILINSGKYPNLQVIHASGAHFLAENQIDACFIILSSSSDPYYLPLHYFNASIIVPKTLCDPNHKPTIQDIMKHPVSVPLGDVQQLVSHQWKKQGVQPNFHVFSNIVFDFEAYIVDILLNNCIGFLVNDSLGKYQEHFYTFDIPELSIRVPVGIKWNSEKDHICRNMAMDLQKIYRTLI